MTAAVRGFIGAAGVNFTPGISGTVILVLLLLLLISYIALRLLRLRAERLRRELEEEKQARAELASFLSRFPPDFAVTADLMLSCTLRR